jgi:hypothetical protein
VIAYEDFDLRIEADGDGFYVSAQRGAQRARTRLELDLSLAWNLWELPSDDRREVEKRGATLFDALIRGDVRDLYQQGRGNAGSDPGKGLRIRIQIDPRDERLRPLVRLPWEILFDHSGDAGKLLALDARRPIVRMIDCIEQHVDPAPLPIRRVLLASAQPTDATHLNLKREYTYVTTALQRDSIQPVVIEHATRTSLREAILDARPQIVHFMGHGTFDPVDGEGVLLLEDATRHKDPLHASILASFFLGRPMPRLVILTSCLTGVTGRERTSAPFSSIAAALIAAGVPAVIAMQSEVSDKNALRFTESLYRSVLRGEPVEAAISAARVGVYAEDRRSLDWAVPMLFIRSQGGGALDTKVPDQVQPETVQLPPAAEREVRPTHGGVYIHGNVDNFTQNWNKS